MSAPDFATYQAICEVKARYCRCIDTKDWAGYADCFTEDAVLDSTPAGGTQVTGRDALAAFVERSLAGAVTVHQVHSPEFRMDGPDAAHVVWAMQDRVVFAPAKAAAMGVKSLIGFGHYTEDYRLCADGRWRIARSTLSRLHTDFEGM